MAITVTREQPPHQVADLADLSPADLSPAEVLARLGDAETAERRAGVAKLELALQWCVLHPATADTGTAVWGDAGLFGFEDCEDTLGGDGCPPVAAYAPEPFATTLGVSTFTGMQLLADALDLAHRLPRTWRKTRALAVTPWKARRLAQATHHLSAQAASYVDDQLADRIDSCGSVLIDRTVAQAAARFDPTPLQQAEDHAKATWDVKLEHRTDGGFAGTSHLAATGDTLDLTKFYDLVCEHATHLARLGDTDPLGVRKAKALGLIADAQTHLDLYGTTLGKDAPAETTRRPSLAKTRMYLHLDGHDLLDPTISTGAGDVERLGPATLARIREWLGASRATIVAVLNPTRDDAVDHHDPPPWMRETVILRDGHCVFPWCRVDARSCDLDHITPYVPMDRGGPPGQTSPSKLACLCRRHHNAKTTGRWRYQRHKDGTYTWHGPHALTYLVTPTDTTPFPRA
jgi:hypothetical protein